MTIKTHCDLAVRAARLCFLPAILFLMPQVTQRASAQSACDPGQLLKIDGISPHLWTLAPKRLLIVTPQCRQDRLREHDTYARSLASYLRANGRFDVVVSQEYICENKIPMRSGRFDERDLLRYAQRYNVDTVLFCELPQLSAYEPMNLNATFAIVSIEEAIALVSGSGYFDLRHPAIYQDYANFSMQTSDMHSPATHPHSPSRFIDYCASKASEGLLALWQQPKEKPQDDASLTAEAEKESAAATDAE
ncbi:MAG: hypothetical protein AAGG44_19565 [Planctomycetota bacterium]